MSRRLRHRWDLSAREAIALQQRLAPRVERRDRLPEVRTVAGVDASYDEARKLALAAVAVLAFPGLQRLDQAIARVPVAFPYVPGLLSFRELPAVLAAFERLRALPDLVLCDGQGIAHPRRFGIASHLGLLLDLPTIGVAKTRLVGEHRAPPDRRGAWTPLTDRDEAIGAVVRTRKGAKPLYVSIGHRVSLASAVRWTMACTTRYRLPETTRAADRLAATARAA
ncbi:MAG: deoxyribonuclease V [Burkholderiales bacterium]|nr:deoxyribonuclease V [Burkholderiales bacterium]